jgi:hypothetical protein
MSTGFHALCRHRRGGVVVRGRLALAAALILLTFLLAASAGCGSNARAYAQEARSSYINARAVLVGVEEFPSEMERLLRSGSVSTLEEEASELIVDARDLLPTASSTFRTTGENANLLKGEDSEKYTPYAEMLLELTTLNEQLINTYSEFIAISNSVMQGLLYNEDPESLMPTLDSLDGITVRIQETKENIERLEEETEALYLEITK